MARIMTLDGLDQARIAEIRAQLSQPELSWWNRPIGLGGVLDPITANPIWALGGVLLGAWLAGSAKGRSLVRRFAKR